MLPHIKMSTNDKQTMISLTYRRVSDLKKVENVPLFGNLWLMVERIVGVMTRVVN